MRIALVVALALVPSIASAQTPEEAPVEAAPEVAPEAEAPVEAAAPEAPVHEMAPVPARGPFAAVVVAAAPKPADLRKRWGVSARMVSLALSDGTTDSEYSGGGIAASYRINKRWELVLALDALDAPEGRDLHSTSLDVRFHITPHRRWDWYGIIGVGALHEVPLEGEADEGVSRGRMHVGVGLQRRFRSWSLGAELHSVGVGPVTDEAMSTARTTTPMATDEGLTGGEATIAATLFF